MVAGEPYAGQLNRLLCALAHQAIMTDPLDTVPQPVVGSHGLEMYPAASCQNFGITGQAVLDY